MVSGRCNNDGVQSADFSRAGLMLCVRNPTVREGAYIPVGPPSLTVGFLPGMRTETKPNGTITIKCGCSCGGK